MSGSNLDGRLETFRQRVVGRSISEGTFTDYEKWIRRFEAWLDGTGRSVTGITELEDYDQFLADESRTSYPWDNGRGRPAPPAYAYRSRTNAISAAKKWVRREYNITVPETPGDICIGSPKAFDPTYLTPDEVDAVIAQAGNCGADGCEVALRLAYDAILRVSELVRVERDDIDTSQGTLYVKATKGSQNATIGLDERTRKAVAQYCAAHPQRDRLFRNSYGNGWRPNSLAKHIQREHTEAGAHAIGRHTPIMHRLESADPPFVRGDYTSEDFGDVYQRARHNQPSMTSQYAKAVGVNVPSWSSTP